MAIDTKTKRFSMMSRSVGIPLVPPDGTIDQGDRQTFAGLYGRLLAGVVATLAPVNIIMSTMYINRAVNRDVFIKKIVTEE